MNNENSEYKDAWEEHELNGDFIEWNHWVHRMDILNSEQACLLMSGLDPIQFTDIRPSGKQDAVDKAINKAKQMLAYAQSKNVNELSPPEWIRWSDEAGFKVHYQFRLETTKLFDLQAVHDSGQLESAPIDICEPLTSGEVAEYFCGFKWKTTEQGKKALSKKPALFTHCIVSPGIRGKQQIQWNPVQVGGILVSKGYAKANQIRGRFMRQPRLQIWLEQWKDYEANYLDSDS